jgi:thioredoxin 1
MKQNEDRVASRNSSKNPQKVSDDKIRTVTSGTFNQFVLEGDGPIAVEFMSYGCSYCRELEPIMQQVAEMVESKGEIFRVNIAVEQELANTYEIQSTPTLVMFLNGKNVGTVEGPNPTVPSVMTAITHPFRVKK